ncbi:MAG TPA: hypothetical protein VIT44_08985, partial [Cyclobacteriaceae bacterium]
MIKRFYYSLSSVWWKGAFIGMITIILIASISASISFPFGVPIIVNVLAGIVVGTGLLYLLL